MSNITQRLLYRYEKCRGDIARRFSAGKDPGAVKSTKETGDPHLHGESVTRIETENGLVLYYKPRDCRSTELCGDLTELLFGERMVPCQVTGEGYAFQKEVSSRIPQTEEEKAEYYGKLGRLTAMFHALGSTDMHNGNIVCSADGPVVLDTETLLCAKAEGIGGAGEFSVDYGEIFPALQISVGECMVLPRFYGFCQTSPLILPESSWIEDLEKSFTEGFREGYRTILEKREELCLLLEEYRDAPFRYLLRSTQSYAARVWLYEQAKDDAAREAILQKLGKGLSEKEAKRFAPVLAWEAQCIRDGIIPYFCLYAGRKELYGDASAAPLIGDYLEAAPIGCARARIDRFGQEDLEVQCAYISASLKHIDGWEPLRQASEDPEEQLKEPPENDAGKEPLTAREAAEEIEIALQKLWEERIRAGFECWGLQEESGQDILEMIPAQTAEPASGFTLPAYYGKADCISGGRAGTAAALILKADPDSLKEAGRILNGIRQGRKRKGCYTVYPGKRRSYFLPSFYYGSTGIAYVMLRYMKNQTPKV